jgi:hypothetical protein
VYLGYQETSEQRSRHPETSQAPTKNGMPHSGKGIGIFLSVAANTLSPQQSSMNTSQTSKLWIGKIFQLNSAVN